MYSSATNHVRAIRFAMGVYTIFCCCWSHLTRRNFCEAYEQKSRSSRRQWYFLVVVCVCVSLRLFTDLLTLNRCLLYDTIFFLLYIYVHVMRDIFNQKWNCIRWMNVWPALPSAFTHNKATISGCGIAHTYTEAHDFCIAWRKSK